MTKNSNLVHYILKKWTNLYYKGGQKIKITFIGSKSKRSIKQMLQSYFVISKRATEQDVCRQSHSKTLLFIPLQRNSRPHITKVTVPSHHAINQMYWLSGNIIKYTYLGHYIPKHTEIDWRGEKDNQPVEESKRSIKTTITSHFDLGKKEEGIDLSHLQKILL